MKIIKTLKALMKFRGLTQGDMAEIMGVTNVTIHKWLSGKTALKVDDLEKMADELGYELVFKKKGTNYEFEDEV